MKVRKKVTLVIEYEQRENGFPANPAKWAWEELLGETVLSVKSEDAPIDVTREVNFEVGDTVRLTGWAWREWEMDDEVVTIEDHNPDEGPIFTYGDHTYVIYVNEDEDYSATKVEDLNIPGEPPLCLAKRMGGLGLTCTRSEGHVGLHVAHAGLAGPALDKWMEGE